METKVSNLVKHASFKIKHQVTKNGLENNDELLVQAATFGQRATGDWAEDFSPRNSALLARCCLASVQTTTVVCRHVRRGFWGGAGGPCPIACVRACGRTCAWLRESSSSSSAAREGTIWKDLGCGLLAHSRGVAVRFTPEVLRYKR